MKLYTIVTKNEIKFPNICASCGIETQEEITIDVIKHWGLTSLIGFVIPMGNIISGLQSLNKSYVKIKCCERCNKTFDYNFYSFLMFILAILLFNLLLFINIDKNPIIGMMIVATATFLLFSCLLPYTIGKHKSSKVFIEYKSGEYIYKFENESVFLIILQNEERKTIHNKISSTTSQIIK